MKKVKFKYCGVEFEIRESAYRAVDYYGKPITPKFDIGRVEGASMIKQYIKKNYPSLKVWSVSDSFSMGNSIDVYICNEDCSTVSDEIHKEISTFANSLRMGRFNGMIDMYEHKEWDNHTDDGVLMDTHCKYIHVNNKPKFGTIEWGINRLMEDPEETKEGLLYYIDKNKKEKFLELAI